MDSLTQKVALDLGLNQNTVAKTLKLLIDEQCSIPFVARYRKEVTDSMDEVMLRSLRDRYVYVAELEAMRDRYLKVVEEHCKAKPELSFEKLKAKFYACQTKQELEDLYLPFKPKRRTRAQAAKEKGLDALLSRILAAKSQISDLLALAAEFVTPAGASVEKDKVVASAAEALSGAADILAEQISENPEIRALVRQRSFSEGMIVAAKNENIAETGAPVAEASVGKSSGKKVDEKKFENYFDYREKIGSAVSHRIMAVRRGEAEKILRVHIEVDIENILGELRSVVVDPEPATKEVKEWMSKVVEDAYKRLLAPSIETEIRIHLKNTAEAEAIKVFSQNLQNLLLLPPIPFQTVLGVDPGIRTGSKLAVVSETGKLLEYTTVYPDLFAKGLDAKNEQVKRIIADLVKKHRVGFIAIGNGTGSREIDQLIIACIKEHGLRVKRVMVNEAGASVYSTEAVAREEFPDLDPTIRSAVSIARRLQDPLAELVKIEPRSIGVGQYQHDCNAIKLNDALSEIVESCVNRVGVNVNTASYKLLGYVAGIGPTLAKNIVNFRDEHGPFRSRNQLTSVSGFGPKSYLQSAGFLRIHGGENPLDNSAVHPESYPVVEQIAKDLELPVAELIGKQEQVSKIPLEKYVSDSVGLPTLRDIAQELIKPGRDPRTEGSRLTYSDDVHRLEDLKVGAKLKGTVSNVTNFGAFVDIGVHQDGLVHISELSDNFVKDPTTVVAVGKVVDVWVLDVDVARKRISLSCREPREGEKREQIRRPQEEQRPQRNGASQRPMPSRDQERHRPRTEQRNEMRAGQRHDAPRRPQRSVEDTKHYSVGDLLSKFNSRT